VSTVFSLFISKIGDSKVTSGSVPPPITLSPFSMLVEKEIDLAIFLHLSSKEE